MKFALCIAAILAAIFIAAPHAWGQGNAGKVFVCKYVGTPGDGERLQTGQNPIDVSVNAIKDYAGVGSYFNDAQGRSYVLAEDTGQGEPDVSQCPGYVPPSETCEDRGDCPVTPPPPPVTCEDTDTCPLPPPPPSCEDDDTCPYTPTCEELDNCPAPPPPPPPPTPEPTCEDTDTCEVPPIVPPVTTCEDRGDCPVPPPVPPVDPPTVPPTTCQERGDCPALSTAPHPPTPSTHRAVKATSHATARAGRTTRGDLPRTGAPLWLLGLMGALSVAAGFGLRSWGGRR